MVAALAPKARAGLSISIRFDAPVVYHPPLVVVPPPRPVCPPPVIVTRPPVVCAPAPVYVPVRHIPVGRPVVFVPPGHARKYGRYAEDYRGWNGKGHGKPGWGKHSRY